MPKPARWFLRKIQTFMAINDPRIVRIDFTTDDGVHSYLLNRPILEELEKACTITLRDMTGKTN